MSSDSIRRTVAYVDTIIRIKSQIPTDDEQAVRRRLWERNCVGAVNRPKTTVNFLMFRTRTLGTPRWTVDLKNRVRVANRRVRERSECDRSRYPLKEREHVVVEPSSFDRNHVYVEIVKLLR
jgi:hypothetical protein